MNYSLSARIVAGAASTLLAAAVHAAPVVVYDSLGPAVFNLPSLGYQATSTSELGDRISFGSGPRTLDTVTVRMSSWALQSTYVNEPIGANAAGYYHDLTFNIYGAGSGGTPGALITTITANTLVPWRPEASAGCGTGWMASNGSCYNGFAFDVTFDFSSLGVTLPDEIVFGLAFNTQSYGAAPIGTGGPYNSLNFGLASLPPTVGIDSDADALFINTSWAGALTTGAVGSFNQDSGWAGYVPAVQFVTLAVPEPGSLALAGLALFGLAASRRRRA